MDLVADREWFLELTRQLQKTRSVAVGGILRKYLRDLESAKEDLKDEVDSVVDEESLFFQWKGKLKKYKERDNRD